ncbi:MAG: response regulator transcription factor [Candidatus Omnitrophica bacterium]|nr:response regulator transcription factor [Candidatus Omnitrophota bacterium]MBU1924969.1 response regulator transcription factor [Candidatus Omnitrophota bacterium]MBU2063888.1 response regulator transcription factor [Candidatus Omnitrophota bacterium]
MRKKKILFVDDEVDLARLLIFKLEKEGFEVIFAEDGKEALCALEKKPDLILLDIWLPDIDGYEVCRKIRLDARFKKIPIIFFTASAEAREKIAYNIAEFGAQDFIIKPFDTKVLLEKIRKHINTD